MRMKLLLICTVALLTLPATAHNDHRGHNLDSLERVVARWTPDAMDAASDEELLDLNAACRELMLGYSNILSPKCEFYARKALSISEPRGWVYANIDAWRYIGQCFWGDGQLDSARFYYTLAMEATDRMEAGVPTPLNPEGYEQWVIDDTRSMLYGTLGNLYNSMGDIPKAMELYEKAGALFEQYGWYSNCAILYYNMGETWLDEGEPGKARGAYQKALDFARTAEDSLWIAGAQKGLGRTALVEKKPREALRYLYAADEYYVAHDREEPIARKETMQYISEALRMQRRQMIWIVSAIVLALLTVIGVLLLGRKRRAARREQAAEEAVKPKDIAVPAVTEREKEILDLLAKGYTTPQIAEGLGLSAETVKWYRKKLLVKFDVANAAELVIRAKAGGII